MTLTQLLRARWTSTLWPAGEHEELMAAWITTTPPRILTCVRAHGDIFVLARTVSGENAECWLVTEYRR